MVELFKMAVIVGMLGVIFLAAPAVALSENCSHMTDNPRKPRPTNVTKLNFEGMSWRDMPLLPAEDREDVCMDGYLPLSRDLGNQNIYMKEEIKGDVAITKVNYNGSEKPYVEPNFKVGTFADLGPQIRRGVDGSWYLYITKRQDYESGKVWYVFDVRVSNDTFAVQVALMIVNIDERAIMMKSLKTGGVSADFVDLVADKDTSETVLHKPYVQFALFVVLLNLLGIIIAFYHL